MIKKKSIIFVILALITATAFSGCGKVIQEIDKNKTQIYVSVFDGGFGADWLQAAATEFNGQNEKYEVVLKPNKDDLSAVYYMLNNGTNTAQVYFAQESIYVKQLIINDKLEDLTDVYASKPDGENGKTVKEKINNVSVYESAYSVKGNSGIYALPHLQNLWGLYYDNNMFIENNWAFFAEATDEGDLTSQGIAFEKSGKYYIFKSSTGKTNYKAGDKLLSRGKDGVFGTYDDGQPRSLAELETLLNKVSITNGSKGFIWTGKLLDYTKGMLESLLGQYDGADAVKLFYDYEGTYKGESITTADGHKVWGMDGLAKGINFQKDYMMDGKYVHPASVLTGTSHVDAQNLYLYGYEKTKDNPQAAYILEGNWWEREARGTMDSIAQEGYPEKAYGKGDYRILLWPEMSGQKGIDGTGKGTVYAVNDSGAIYVAKNADSEMKTEIKKFLTLTSNDKYLNMALTNSCMIRPFEYTLNDSDYANMTKFTKNIFEMYSDTENVQILNVDKFASPISYSSTKPSNNFNATVGSSTYTTPIAAFIRNVDAVSYISGMKTYYSSKWSTYYNEVKNIL